MKKLLLICMMLTLAGAAASAKGGDSADQLRTSARFYGGIGLSGPYVKSIQTLDPEGESVSFPRLATAVYGFSVQRDILPRLALEIDVQNSYRNNFPAAADYVYGDFNYSGIQDLPAFRDYMDKWIADGKNPNNIDWVRHNSLAVTLRPIFHIINTPAHRFSAYAGIGFHITDGTGFSVDCSLPAIAPEEYTTEQRQYHMVGLAGAAGVRYEYTFCKNYLIGVDLGAAFNDNEAAWHKESTRLNWYDCRALVYIGFRF